MPPDLVKNISDKEGVNIKIPKNFLDHIAINTVLNALKILKE